MANRAALTGHLTYLDLCPSGLNGTYHQQTEGNEHKLGSCLVEFFSRPPSAGRRRGQCQQYRECLGCRTHELGNYFRLRELIHGERASRSIVNKTTALWSIWTMAAYLSASISTHAASDKYFAFRLLDCRHRAR